MQKIIEDRYPTDEWNIYAAQASDGENFGKDSLKCEELLNNVILPICQYFAYVEIMPPGTEDAMNDTETGGDLWDSYVNVDALWPSFEMLRVSEPAHIYPMFRRLFSVKGAAR